MRNTLVAWLFTAALFLLPVSALAQSTANQVIPGNNTISGCPGSTTPCFVPYSATNPLPVSGGAATTGGATPYHLAGGTGASTNSTSIKGSAGTLYSLTAINTTGTIYYLRMYDAASAPTCSSATGAVHSYPVPASATGAGLTVPIGAVGEAYANGIGFCVTGGGGDTDNTNAATGVYINASYK